MARVKRKGPERRRQGLTHDEYAILVGGDLANAFSFFVSDAELREPWEFARDSILREWTRARPGTRPPGWWRFDAPEEPRLRLGGTGTAWEDSVRGRIPEQWVDKWEVGYYTGRQVDVDGALIGVEYVGEDFDGVAIDPNDPPLFESEPAYLRRLGLLLPGEEGRIPAEDFEPILVEAPEVEA